MALFQRFGTGDSVQRTGGKTPIVSDPLATPDWFPMRIDSLRDVMLFVPMSRDAFRQAAFLDMRDVVPPGGATTLRAPMPKLLTRHPLCPIQFILHGGYGGSTLLARYLEELPHCLVLKEPDVLGQLSSFKNQPLAPGKPDRWGDQFKVVFAMLARAYPFDTAVVVKASCMCNWMANSLLDHDEKTKIVFMVSPLRLFLLQILKVEHRRRWLREHMKFLVRPMYQVPFLMDLEAENLTDGQRAATMWLLNSFLCRSLLERPDSHRVRVLNGESLISQPKEPVIAAADFLGLLDDDTNRAAVDGLRPLSYHAKDSRLPYGAAARANELADAEARCGSEVEAAMSWASAVSAGWLRQSPFPME